MLISKPISGKTFKRLREVIGLSQQNVAEQLNIKDRGTIKRLENNAIVPLDVLNDFLFNNSLSENQYLEILEMIEGEIELENYNNLNNGEKMSNEVNELVLNSFKDNIFSKEREIETLRETNREFQKQLSDEKQNNSQILREIDQLKHFIDLNNLSMEKRFDDFKRDVNEQVEKRFNDFILEFNQEFQYKVETELPQAIKDINESSSPGLSDKISGNIEALVPLIETGFRLFLERRNQQTNFNNAMNHQQNLGGFSPYQQQNINTNATQNHNNFNNYPPNMQSQNQWSENFKNSYHNYPPMDKPYPTFENANEQFPPNNQETTYPHPTLDNNLQNNMKDKTNGN